LDPDASKICTINFAWGKYSYLRLLVGIACSPNIFQLKMPKLVVPQSLVAIYPLLGKKMRGGEHGIM
jgi:hypothetical protein